MADCRMTMDCQLLNEDVYNRIENILKGPTTNKSPKEETSFKSYYSPATLINNWQESRLSGYQHESLPEPMVTEHRDKYRPTELHSVPNRRECFNKLFEGYGLDKELIFDHLGFSYYDNFTSTNDLCYNHLTKGICGPYPRHNVKGKYKPETDLTLVFGNLTQWGLKERHVSTVAEEEDEKDIIPTSETRAEYICHDLAEVKKINDFKTFKRVKAVY